MKKGLWESHLKGRTVLGDKKALGASGIMRCHSGEEGTDIQWQETEVKVESGFSMCVGKWSVLGQGGVTWSRKWDEGHESRTGWKIRRTETSEKGKSILLLAYVFKFLYLFFENCLKLVPRGCQQ